MSPANPAGSEGACPDCGGSGWKIIERDGVSGAERCSCALAARPSRIEHAAGIPPLYSSVALDTFRTSGYLPLEENSMRQLLVTLRAFVREYPVTDPPGLLFVGEPGTGKTHLAVAVLRALIAKGWEGIFFDYQTLLDRIRSSYDPMSGAPDRDAYRTALDSELLMLDDLGAHRANEFTQDIVTSILTHRCNNRKPLIVTTNLPIEQGAEPKKIAETYSKRTLGEVIGWRAVSRLHEMCRIVRMPINTDYRMRRR